MECVCKISVDRLVIDPDCRYLSPRGYGLEGVPRRNDQQNNDQSSQHGKKATSSQKPKQ